MLSIYIHIPFCIKKCLYCDFLSFTAEEDIKEAYVMALLAEIEQEAPQYAPYLVDTVFIGGGTPSVLDAEWIEKILCKLNECYHFAQETEITIEVNPGTVDGEKLKRYRKAGINRISIGTQSVHDTELQVLGRIHSAADFMRTFQNARDAGFDNINVDLMSALPGQTMETYKETLRVVTDLKPEHISAYSLIVEEETPFFDMYGGNSRSRNVLPLPSEEEERLMYKETERCLKTRGYHRYEISNYALEGKECRHNIVYWKRKNYAGFGLGASSMIENVRWKNHTGLEQYIHYFLHKADAGIKEEIQHLTVQEQMEEFMFLGLRLSEGVSREEFRQAFHRGMEDIYGDVLKKLFGQKLIEGTESIKLTSFGKDISNYIMSQFMF